MIYSGNQQRRFVFRDVQHIYATGGALAAVAGDGGAGPAASGPFCFCLVFFCLPRRFALTNGREAGRLMVPEAGRAAFPTAPAFMAAKVTKAANEKDIDDLQINGKVDTSKLWGCKLAGNDQGPPANGPGWSG